MWLIKLFLRYGFESVDTGQNKGTIGFAKKNIPRFNNEDESIKISEGEVERHLLNRV